ncbi:type I secretion system permease/ATPase [Hoeflea prorocentri]|uniref:Type I secretion system permease/ATPase n=1 Tax=Hoeflea prorocentri TaxID=1922333 RepID=A0A9X3ZIJ3_9HYPH|nr:type I secretion system permease/ATPase [Hoeflea prorocentri]MCY6381795.1 type I secretion system permease/ATPase [Hoeflea prorocentri]MDA5399595.1 type I secretion system permease/ATPase [Hoeflea prorocentri]
MSIKDSQFQLATRRLRSSFIGVGLFSAAVNILMLTGPLFMLQIYDRVLSSRSVPTLVALVVLVGVLYAFMAVFDFIRVRLLSRAAHRFDLELMPLAQKTLIYQGLAAGRLSSRPEQDLSAVRQFVGSNGPVALLDLPWVPFYLALVFLLHQWLGFLALAGALIVITLALINEFATRGAIREGAGHEFSASLIGQQVHDNSEPLVAMGMAGRMTDKWGEIRRLALAHTQRATGTAEMVSASSRAFRLLLQSSILALGAYLAIHQQISAGAIVAASIIAGRALAPVDQAIGQWKGFVRARLAFSRLKKAIGDIGLEETRTQLPEPEGTVDVSGLIKLMPEAEQAGANNRPPILQDINFKLRPGDGLGVIGPSTAGKSSLARLLTGIWLPDRGSVTLDGAGFSLWDQEALGRHIGYLPQDVCLINGTIRQNVSRFDAEAQDYDVIAAAQLAGVHDMVLALPEGYDTTIGQGGTMLSGGQAQRIALAQAVYKQPALVVLDEPNSNMDTEGDAALSDCIKALRASGSTVIVMAHRPSAIASVNKILMLKGGRQVDFGDKQEVLQRATRAVSSERVNPGADEVRVLKPHTKAAPAE